jgi:hypothetical protein
MLCDDLIRVATLARNRSPAQALQRLRDVTLALRQGDSN